MSPHTVELSDLEAMALNAAIDWRAHRRRCSICSTANLWQNYCQLGRVIERAARTTDQQLRRARRH